MALQETTISLDLLEMVISNIPDIAVTSEEYLASLGKVPSTEEELIDTINILEEILTTGGGFFPRSTSGRTDIPNEINVLSLSPGLEKSKFYFIEGEDDFV